MAQTALAAVVVSRNATVVRSADGSPVDAFKEFLRTRRASYHEQVLATAMIFLGATLALQASEAKTEASIELLKRAEHHMDQISPCQVQLWDNIRHESKMFFQRRLADETVERTLVRSLAPLSLELENRDGKWLVEDNEAIKIEFEARKPAVLQDLLLLLTKYPEDIIATNAGTDVVEGSPCSIVEALLSPKLTRVLANQFREEHKGSLLLRRDPSGDTLQFIAKRRIYWIGTEDVLLHRYKAYDGNGDLLSDQIASVSEMGVILPNAIFAIPVGCTVFVAHTQEQLAKHNITKAKQAQRTIWRNLAKLLSSIVTTNPPVALPAGGGK